MSREGDVYEVALPAARMSKLVMYSIDGGNEESPISDLPLPSVQGIVLAKVIAYCQHYQTEPMTEIIAPLPSVKLEEIVQQWYCDFVKIENVMLFKLIAAANYMNIQPLLDLLTLAVSMTIKGKSADEIRKIFSVSNDFSPEDEAQVSEENILHEDLAN